MQKLIGILLSGMLLTACGGDDGHHHHSDMPDNHSHDEAGAEQIDQTRTISDIPGEVASVFDGMLDDYLQMAGSLVEGDAVQSAAHGEQLRRATELFLQIDMGQELAAQLEQTGAEILTHSENISQESDVEEQRSTFENLSLGMITLVEKIGHQKNELYHQRCPMVNGGNGDWLSTQEQILNPYHGDRMLNCGSTVRVL